MFVQLSMAPGQVVSFKEAFDFVRVMDSTFPVSLEFFRDGREVEEAASVTAGYSEQFKEECTEVKITNGGSAQTVNIATRLGSRVGYDRPPTGDVNVKNTSGAFTQAAATVANVSGQLVAANDLRRYLTIQNKDEAGIVYVNTSGAAATVANGLKIEPGGSLVFENFAPSGQINAIGSIASNANVVIVEG